MGANNKKKQYIKKADSRIKYLIRYQMLQKIMVDRRIRTFNSIHSDYLETQKRLQEQQRIPPVSTMLSQQGIIASRPTMLPSQEKLSYPNVVKSADDRPYQCNACQKKFRQLGHLQQHIRIHTNDRPYQCAHCDKAFKQKSQVNQHERIHTGEKPYQCNICFRAFPQAGQLYSHKKSSHGLDARIKNQHISDQIVHNKTKRGRKRRLVKNADQVAGFAPKQEEGPLPVFVFVLDPNAGKTDGLNDNSVSNKIHQEQQQQQLQPVSRQNFINHQLSQVIHQ